MTFRNSSEWPTREARELVRFATSEIDMSGVHVHLKPCRGNRYRGRAYESVPSVARVPPGTRYLVTLGVGDGLTYPAHPYRFRRGEPAWVGWTWQEVLVHTAAHEACHIEQFREKLPCSEVRCNVFAWHVLDAFRSGSLDSARLRRSHAPDAVLADPNTLTFSSDPAR